MLGYGLCQTMVLLVKNMVINIRCEVPTQETVQHQRHSRSEWAQIIADWRASDLSMAQYARQVGIHKSRLYYWSREMERRPTSPAATALPTGTAAATTLVFDYGVRLEVGAEFDATTLATLVAILQAQHPRSGRDGAV